MKDFRDRSKEKLESEVGKLIHDLMVSCLDRAEKILGANNFKQDVWRQFRFNILNLGNDKLRYLKDYLNDYSIEFRPTSIFSVEYDRQIPKDQLVEIYFEASSITKTVFKLRSSTKSLADDLQRILGCGSVVPVDDSKKWDFIVEDFFSAFHKLIPFFDNNKCFKGKALDRYKEWKEKVYNLEKGNA